MPPTGPSVPDAPDEIRPTPISAFNNSKLRDSIAAALEGVPAGHGHAILTVDNKGAGVMLVERFNDTWSLTLAGRYSFEDQRPEVQAALQASW